MCYSFKIDRVINLRRVRTGPIGETVNAYSISVLGLFLEVLLNIQHIKSPCYVIYTQFSFLRGKT